MGFNISMETAVGEDRLEAFLTPATAVELKACWPANKTESAAQPYLSGHQRLSDNTPHRPSTDLVPEPVMNSPTQSLACFLSWILLFIPWLYPRPLSAAERPWIEFRDCRYIEHEYNDGDSFRLQCGEQAFVARLYFVDAPESKLRNPDRVQEQSEHFGITIDEVLRGGHQAARVVREALQHPFILWTRWAHAGGQSGEPRYYCFVEVDAEDLAKRLVRQGWARTKGIKTKGPSGDTAAVTQEALFILEHQAQEARRGLWATSVPGLLRQASPADVKPPEPGTDKGS